MLHQTTYPPPPPSTTTTPPPSTPTASTGADLGLPVTGLSACLVVGVLVTAIARKRAQRFESK